MQTSPDEKSNSETQIKKEKENLTNLPFLQPNLDLR